MKPIIIIKCFMVWWNTALQTPWVTSNSVIWDMSCNTLSFFLFRLANKNSSYEPVPCLLLLFVVKTFHIQCAQFMFFFHCGSNSQVVLMFCEFCTVKWLYFFCLTIGSKQMALCNDISLTQIQNIQKGNVARDHCKLFTTASCKKNHFNCAQYTMLIDFYTDIFQVWNRFIRFPLFWMGKLVLRYECFKIWAMLWNKSNL